MCVPLFDMVTPPGSRTHPVGDEATGESQVTLYFFLTIASSRGSPYCGRRAGGCQESDWQWSAKSNRYWTEQEHQEHQGEEKQEEQEG